MKILNLLFRDPKLKDIKVGSVEEFQGQVRSSRIVLEADILLSNPRRNAK